MMNNLNEKSSKQGTWPANMPSESKRTYEICLERSEKRTFIPFFISFGIPLIIGITFMIVSAFQSGNLKGAFLAFGFIFIALGIALLISAIILKAKRDNAVRYVRTWRMFHPEEKIETKKMPTKPEVIPQEPSNNTSVDEIIKAKKLLEEGAITEEEFAQIKRKILSE